MKKSLVAAALFAGLSTFAFADDHAAHKTTEAAPANAASAPAPEAAAPATAEAGHDAAAEKMGVCKKGKKAIEGVTTKSECDKHKGAKFTENK